MPTLDGVDGTFYEVRQNPQSFSIGINITANTTIMTNGQSIGLTVRFFIYHPNGPNLYSATCS